jgi:predicted DNA-binding transcriptional regulator YafY
MELHKFERQLRLMMLLTQNRKYTLEELGQRLDMSSRNVYRYIEAFKMAGFIVRKTGSYYSLDKASPYFKDISSLVHFTEEEAYILKRAIESVDGNTSLKQNLKEKLYKVYDYEILSEIVVRSGIADNVHNLYEAIKQKKQVAFHQYKSSNSHAVTDRVVEPFAFTANNNEIWCYEPGSGKNKLFKVSRITSVEVLDAEWEDEPSHKEGFIDVFHISSELRLPVTLRLGMTAANLLVEEFPLAEKYMEKEDETHWIFKTEVCRYEGIGRFVLGLFEDIEIIDSPEFSQYIIEKAKKISDKIQN